VSVLSADLSMMAAEVVETELLLDLDEILSAARSTPVYFSCCSLPEALVFEALYRSFAVL
jgi:hypothetical protein